MTEPIDETADTEVLPETTTPFADTITFRRKTFLMAGAAALAFVVLTVTFASGVAVGRHSAGFGGRDVQMMQQGFRGGAPGVQQGRDGRGWDQRGGSGSGYQQ